MQNQKSIKRYISHSVNKGFILLIVLFLLQMMTIMALYLLNAGLLTYQSSQQYWQRYQFFTKAENILHQVIQDDEDHCLFDRVLTDNLRSQSIEWWRNNTCCSDDYCYVIELITANVCMIDHDDYIPIKYLRYTVFSFNQQKHYRELLQSVVIKLDNANQRCVEVSSDIYLGQQSWRRL